jgi:hypothetical protein
MTAECHQSMPFNSLRMPQLRSGRIKPMKILFKNNHLSVENPRVTGSIPVSATNKIKLTAMWAFFTPTLFGVDMARAEYNYYF